MCSFLATPAEFRKQGCPNCEDKLEVCRCPHPILDPSPLLEADMEWLRFLQMKGDADRVLSCTTGQFDGVIAAINPEESWVVSIVPAPRSFRSA